MSFARALAKEAFRLALKANSLWGKAMKVIVWIITIGILVGIAWIPIDWTLPIQIKLGETGFSIPTGPVIVGAICIFAVCFGIAWHTVPAIVVLQKDDKGEAASGGDLHWRITIKNTSNFAAIKDCQVQIIACEPPIGNLPLPLRAQHEQSTKMDLQAGEERRWDVCRDDGKGRLEFIGEYATEKAPIKFFLVPGNFKRMQFITEATSHFHEPSFNGPDSCKIQIKAFCSDGTPSESIWFELIWIDGELVLRPLSEKPAQN